jgi:hypothetical protein
MGKGGSKWRHGWVPRNRKAALLKAHGSKSGASRIMSRLSGGKSKKGSSSKRGTFYKGTKSVNSSN